MNRTRLIDTLRIIATEAGFAFYTSSEKEFSATVTSYPAMWLSTPQFDSMEGSTHGRITFGVKLALLSDARKLSPEQRASAAAYLEEQLLEALSRLSQTPLVATVENLKISATSLSLSAHGEIAATATAQIVTIF